MKYFERAILALLLLTWCCAAPRSTGRGQRQPRPAHPGTPSVCWFICVPS